MLQPLLGVVITIVVAISAILSHLLLIVASAPLWPRF
jgi:hypothetical protein